jgi:hypothetical protein
LIGVHIPTHILSGWCVGNLLPLTARQRLGCMIAAAAPDIDGLGMIIDVPFGTDLYHDYHHVLGHNLFFCAAVATVLALWTRSWRCWAVYLALGHLHLVMDYLGSGPLWDIYYLWPVGGLKFRNPAAWEFFSWQNITFAGCLLVWTIAIARYRRRTPLEAVMPGLDRQLVALVTPAGAGAGA